MHEASIPNWFMLRNPNTGETMTFDIEADKEASVPLEVVFPTRRAQGLLHVQFVPEYGVRVIVDSAPEIREAPATQTPSPSAREVELAEQLADARAALMKQERQADAREVELTEQLADARAALQRYQGAQERSEVVLVVPGAEVLPPVSVLPETLPPPAEAPVKAPDGAPGAAPVSGSEAAVSGSGEKASDTRPKGAKKAQ